MIKRILFAIATLILFVIIFISGIFWRNIPPKYIHLESVKELDNLKIDEIYLNEINSIRFNFRKTYSLITAELYPVLPAREPQKIKQIIECLKNAEQLHSRPTVDTDSIMFFKSDNRIYYTHIGWDEEKFYGRFWESKELMDLIEQWKHDFSNYIREARAHAGIKQAAISDSFQSFRLSFSRFGEKPWEDLSSEERDEWEEKVKSAYIKHIERRRKEHTERMNTDEIYRRIWTELVEQGVISRQIGEDIDLED